MCSLIFKQTLTLSVFLFPASQWRMWKLCCLRSTTESPTCVSSKTNCRSEQITCFYRVIMNLLHFPLWVSSGVSYSLFSSDPALRRTVRRWKLGTTCPTPTLHSCTGRWCLMHRGVWVPLWVLHAKTHRHTNLWTQDDGRNTQILNLKRRSYTTRKWISTTIKRPHFKLNNFPKC